MDIVVSIRKHIQFIYIFMFSFDAKLHLFERRSTNYIYFMTLKKHHKINYNFKQVFTLQFTTNRL